MGADNGVLCTLEGFLADLVDGTRNGRIYSEKLWNHVFNEDPIVEEMFKCGMIPGELDHPTEDRDTDSSRIAIALREKPQKKDGKLWAKIDVLDTPLGRIAHTLVKAGFKWGISSRGDGDVLPNNEVDPETYQFKCFDLVLLPAVKAARLSLAESLDVNADYKKLLKESLDNSSESDRKIMLETLNLYNITDIEGYASSPNEKEDSIENVPNDNVESNNSDAIVEQLQMTLKENKDLVKQIATLQEKLSVSYTKETELEATTLQQSNAIKKLTAQLNTYKANSTKSESLSESLAKQKDTLTEKFDNQTQKLNSLIEKFNSVSEERNTLSDKLAKLSRKNELTNKKLEKLEEINSAHLKQFQESLSAKDTELKEAIDKNNKENVAKLNTITESLNEAKTLTEKYKRMANKAVTKLIESYANTLGVSKEEIINKLPQNYSFNDIERICESLKVYKTNLNALPFNIKEASKVVVNQSKNDMNYNTDDEVSDSFLTMIDGFKFN